MARSLHGNPMGQAAHIENKEMRQYLAEQADPNSYFWKNKLQLELEKIVEDDRFLKIWDSETVPVQATYKRHYLFAKAIVDGTLKIVTRPGD